MRTTIAKIFLRLVQISLIGAIASVFIVDFGTLFPYVSGRTSFFHIAIEIALVLCTVLLIIDPRRMPGASTVRRIGLLFIAVTILSTMTSIDPGRSLWGSLERALGLFQMLHLAAFVFCLAVAFQSNKERFALIGTSILISVALAVEFLAMKFGWIDATMAYGRMGNQSFLAGYLLFHCFFAWYLIPRTAHRIIKIVLLASALLLIVTIIATGVRGAMIGLVIGCIVNAARAGFPAQGQRRRFILGGAALAGVLIIGFFIWARFGAVRLPPVFERIANISFSDQTFASRRIMWKIALQAAVKHPLLGVGHENFMYVFNTFFDKRFEETGVTELWEDRAHNIFFDELAASGILGLLSLLALYGAIFWRVRHVPALLGLLIAYLIQNMVGVETLNTLIPLALLIHESTHGAASHSESSRIASLTLRAAAALGLIVTVMAFIITIQQMQGKASYLAVMQHIDQRDFHAFYKKAQDSLEAFPSLQNESLLAVSIATGNALAEDMRRATPALVPCLEQFAFDTTASYEKNPDHVRLGYTFVRLAHILAYQLHDASWAQKGLKTVTKIQEISGPRKVFVQEQEGLLQIISLSQNNP